jgi:hypothetical protein
MAFQRIENVDAVSPFASADGPDALISSSSQLPPIIGTGCMACCSGGVDPTWGGVAAASSVTF